VVALSRQAPVDNMSLRKNAMDEHVKAELRRIVSETRTSTVR